jgi:hypothetical protein
MRNQFSGFAVVRPAARQEGEREQREHAEQRVEPGARAAAVAAGRAADQRQR